MTVLAVIVIAENRAPPAGHTGLWGHTLKKSRNMREWFDGVMATDAGFNYIGLELYQIMRICKPKMHTTSEISNNIQLSIDPWILSMRRIQ